MGIEPPPGLRRRFAVWMWVAHGGLRLGRARVGENGPEHVGGRSTLPSLADSLGGPVCPWPLLPAAPPAASAEMAFL